MHKCFLKTIIIFLFGLLFFEVNAQNTHEDKIFLQNSNRIISELKNFNYHQLLEDISPDIGLRFSPYAHIDTIQHVLIFPKDIKNMINSKENIHWGSYDGSGDPINMDFFNYHLKFVYDVDFQNAEKTSLNKFIGSGNSLNNLINAYPDCRFVEYYFSGFDIKYGGMDWKTLRLVYKKKNGKYYLVGIVHDQWTI